MPSTDEQIEQATVLPKTSELSFYEMRFELADGLGTNLAGQILAEAMVLSQRFSGAHFSLYALDKRDSPVKSYVRVCSLEKKVERW